MDSRIDELRRRLERDPGSRLFAQLAEGLEATAFTVGTNILRLFGSDRAFFFAAAFGAGASAPVDAAKCPVTIKQAQEMVGRLKVLASR